MEGPEPWWILDINDQYGVIFGWLDGKAYEVEACDYHETKFGPA
jgi:plasmid maintenance system killer protein